MGRPKLCRLSGGKVKFPSHESAAIRAGEILAHNQAQKALWTYRCPACGRWHLTSHDPMAGDNNERKREDYALQERT